ncbi:MAG TPA: ubiquinol-cytochrome c reductase iron-sulfur subunit [Gemmataceae bacterium]|nr:ubiquinol-cytochrome c reductase iron-sulfur subunit [Gemmataceae bacterium]
MSEPTPNPPAPAATPKPATPPLPPKPAPKAPAKAGTTRRGFLGAVSWIGTAWITFTGSMALMTLGTVRFLFPNVLSEPPSTFRAGDPANYEDGKVEDKFKPVGAWVIRNRDPRGRDVIYALSTTCTHLGCNPNWLDAEKKFKCPCHGSGFRISGINFEGPAPRPLERYAIKLSDDGQILVDKSRKFQWELGQWDDADSYILLG